jgi:hypothetical protein
MLSRLSICGKILRDRVKNQVLSHSSENMLQTQSRNHESPPERFERQMRMREEERAAEAQARRAKEARARWQEARPQEDGSRVGRRTPPDAHAQVNGRGSQRCRTIAGSDGAQSIFEMPPELPGTTAPASNSRWQAETPSNSTINDELIQTLRLQLIREQMRRHKVEQDLEYARKQLEQYVAERDSIHHLQDEAVISGDEEEITKLEQRAKNFRKLWRDSLEEVNRLEQELLEKNRTILGLQAQVSSAMQAERPQSGALLTHKENIAPPPEASRESPVPSFTQQPSENSPPSQYNGTERPPKSGTRRGSTKAMLRRDSTGIGIVKDADYVDVPRRLAYLGT